MKSLFRALVLLLAFSAITVSCKKDDPEPEDPSNPTPVPTTPPYFTWTLNTNIVTVADSSYCYPSITTIYAFKGGNANSVEIRLSSFATGNYVVNAVSGNQLEYQSGTQLYNGTGTVAISASEATNLSGSFTCSLNGGTLNAISGSFAAVPKR
jgi:hypothetical protein